MAKPVISSPVVNNLVTLLSPATPIKNLVSLCLENVSVSPRKLSGSSKATTPKQFGRFLSPNNRPKDTFSKQYLTLYSTKERQSLSQVSKCLFSPLKPLNHQKNVFTTPTKNVIFQNDLSFDSPSRNQFSPRGLNKKTEGFVLGKGSYGVVVKGKYKNKKVAVKILKNTSNPAVCRSVYNEINAINLKHPNIVQVFDVIDQKKNKMAFVFMECYNNDNLETVILNKIIPLGIKLKYLMEICCALDYCHQNNILHLDIKPKNVIVSKQDNTTKLCDFGSSRNTSDTTKTGIIPEGTLKYTAPELLKGEMATEKSDVYSYGITMWQIIHQQIPYDNENLHIVVYKVVTQNYRPQEHKETIPNIDVVPIYKACWESDPHIRPSMVKVREKLEEINN